MNIKKILIANRGEIAIRISRACNELNIQTAAIYTYEDRYSLHRYKADEAYQIGEDNDPLKPYLDIQAIIEMAKYCKADAIHPGYGFLSENPEFALQCAENGIIFIGPRPDVMIALGDKITAKTVAKNAQIPIIESNEPDLNSLDIALSEAHRIGFPMILKAASGGGGRGMRVVRTEEELKKAFPEAKSEAKNAFGDDTVFLEKFIERPRHIEVQIVADNHQNVMHLYERDCSVQRRFQKVVEVAPSLNLKDETREELYHYAVSIAKAVNYNNVGTVEFLVDSDERIYFIEVNPRIQVEHTVTEMITGIDLIKTQIYIADGYKLSSPEIGLPDQAHVMKNGFAMQCRITTEDPSNGFKPDYGTLITYRNATGFGVRLDEGSTYPGMKISPFFDSMLVKVSTQGATLVDAARKMNRALREFRIRGVKNNIQFLENLINHPVFVEGKATVNFIQEYPELFAITTGLDRGTRVLSFLGDISLNGNPDVKNFDPKVRLEKPPIPEFDHMAPYPKGTKDMLTELGAEGFCSWLKNEKKIYYTDTTFRDGHQSLLATRMRTYDMLKVAEAYAKDHPQTFSMEAWGGATFDVCLRFLHEDPWIRLQKLRAAMPNILIQMLIRGCNGVGYSAYPDNLVESFVQKSWENGVDVFRIFDSLNWMENIAPCIDMVRKTGGIAEGALCYTGDILDPKRTKYNLDYYLRLAKDLENAGSHILGVKDMSGLLKPYAAKILIEALKDTVKIPIHLHTHDTSSLQSATYMQAIDAGVDVVDCALGALSGMTSQPNFNSIVEMMRFHERENPYNIKSLNQFSNYWESVRDYYHPYESGMKSSSAEVFQHEIPGGQYSNLKPQAIALGLGDKFEEIKERYANVNEMFGDIVKVTPSSKVVGDLAQYMVANNISKEDIFTKGDQISFPESVVSYFMGELGQPEGGFPQELQRIILKGKVPLTDRAGKHIPPLDLEQDFKDFKKKFGDDLPYTTYLSYKFYPKVTEDYLVMFRKYGDVDVVPTKYFLYGMKPGEETTVQIAPGKTLLVRLQSIGPADDKGMRTAFFKLNGQTRNIEVHDRSIKVTRQENRKAEKDNERHVASPLQGMLSKVFVKRGDEVKKNQPLFMVEAMKMETNIAANSDGIVGDIILTPGTLVNTDDLVLEIQGM
ncbi:MAG: pyruvate carboxylase [Sphingobacteriales bacterium 17-39-43]|uniref:pyruvate carboxylase n=1 Tax=Daejeonella sp. TaxID=2805397 RepID=UPI000BD550DB|nr:pyruvate carboxylase [Daejeonella sp.]OYY06111.1 MAG: pyruvate carboxylase [Sphingobacteriia bacterium 35-40-5]OYZ31112.1 MAG: pyruvate carboxylase [Sphingobacteriales bacterium 16-39-50]OZA23953.1 MAG: pyruvate carboxylase [Sphingobacteriales bacterium 17-39-43]HQS50889.1 pyruvate carboxylase [Daejeonella sp.]HQT23292.1 pyruvate carboxylase [Daejeonella sp.]